MDKKLFELQVRHNYFIRFTVVSICKLILWAFIFAVLFGITYYLSLVGVEWATKNTYRPSEYTQKVIVISSAVVIMLSVIYLMIFVKTIMKIISEHKTATNAEKKVYKNIGNSFYDELSAKNNQHIDDEEEL